MNGLHSLPSNIRYPRMHAKLLLHVQLIATPWTVACQAPLSVGYSRQDHWSGLPSRGSPRPCDWTPITCSSCIGLLMDCLPGTTRGSPSNVLSDMFFFPSYIGMVVGMRKSNDLISRWCIIVSGVRPWSNQSRTSSWLVLSWDACLKLKWLIRKNQPHGAAILRRS